jgi:uncharacterized RDD family membrane protein YckC
LALAGRRRNRFASSLPLSDQTHRVEFERGGVWRRASALLIDVIAISAVLQLLAVALFPLSHGRVQFTGGLIYGTSCDKLEKVPDGASVPADFGANSITDCRQSLFGLTSARLLRVSRIIRDGAITKEVWIVRMLDADGVPTAGLELDLLLLPLLLGLRLALDRGRGSPGRRFCRLRLANPANGEVPSLVALTRRYAVLLAALCPALIWSLYASFATSSLEPTLLLSVQVAVGIPVLFLALQALYAAFWRKDAWYDRLAGTSVLRVDRDGAIIPTAAPPPRDLIEGDLSQILQAEFGAGASFSPASVALPPPLPPQGRQNYIARHWRGELSLPLSYWVNGTLGGLIAIFVTGSVGVVTHRDGEAQPMVWLMSLCAVWLLIAVLATWQMVGIWRSATHYQQGGRRFWGGAAKALMVLAGLQVVVSFFTVGSPQIAGMFEIVNGDSRVGPHQFRVLAYGEMLEFSGGITFGVAKEMEGFLNAMVNVKTVRLNSIGGRILEAQKMSDLIKARRLSTLVENDCVSACTIVFLGGNDRAITSNARLGFHQPAFRGMTPADRNTAIANEEQRLQGFGLSRAFAERANSAKPDSMWFPDRAELLREHVVTRIVPLKPHPPKTTAPAAETAPPAVGAAADAAPAMPTAAVQPVDAAPARPGSMTSPAPRAVIPPDVIKRLVDGPKSKPASASAAAPGK